MKAYHWQKMKALGADKLIKVSDVSQLQLLVSGYFTIWQALAGKSPEEMRKLLGLKADALAAGAIIYRLLRSAGMPRFRSERLHNSSEWAPFTE